MAELLVVADDLTGALDSGVQLASKGDHVLVSLDCEDGLRHAADADVLVIDSESRHDTPETAYRKVYDLVRKGRELGIAHFYKKTDSGLRGNVGAELAALLDASGASHVNFVPAYPKQQRVTERGIHYVAGVPLARSIFSVDPVNPVTRSRVTELIHLQSDVPATDWSEDCDRQGILVYDCATDDDMRSIASMIQRDDSQSPCAGCAGLLEMLPRYSTGTDDGERTARMNDQIVVVSGSVNAVTASQLDESERRGAFRAHLPIQAILSEGWDVVKAQAFVRDVLAKGEGSPVILIDTLGYQLSKEELADGTAAHRISEAAGLTAAQLSALTDRTTVMVGGDALVGFVHDVGANLLEPIDELFPGIVVARYQGANCSGTLITKSGAFGSVALFHEIHRVLKERMGGV